MQRAQFVWLFAPQGYVGLSAALEVGFAHAAGIPVYSKEAPSDAILRSFVRVVSSPRAVASELKSGNVPVPQPALQAFQSYYKRVAVQRGYHREDARDCLLLMVEEVGELARAIRKRKGITRHGKGIVEEERSELADVFMYVVHMANILGLNLAKAVREKELRNLQRVARGAAK
jgi:NTP pyrophosphatase (non-canonical NTP hydrolase)